MNAVKRIVDGDGHIIEELDAIAKFIPSPYKEGPINEGKIFPPLDHLHQHNQVTTSAELSGRSFKQGPAEWDNFLAYTGIDTTVVYPTLALSYGRIVSVDWAIAATRAYNDWLYETYMARSPRFRGMGLIPGQHVESAVQELRRIVEDLGMHGAMLPAMGFDIHPGANPYWPIFEEANRLGCTIAYHGGAHSGIGLDRMNRYAPVHAMGHPVEIMLALSSVVFNGLLERYPNVRHVFLEGGVGWIFMALERFDRSHVTHPEYDAYKQWGPQIDDTISEYIKKHINEGRIFFGIEGDEALLPVAVDEVGHQPFVYSSDFPHEVSNEMCKEEIQEVLANEALSDEAKEGILHGNSEQLYNLAPVQV